MEVRSRRPALLDAHDADFGELRDRWVIEIIFAVAGEQDTQERENTSEGLRHRDGVPFTHLPATDRC